MGRYTTNKTTKKRDKCISRKQAENTALLAEIEQLKAKVAELESEESFKSGMKNLVIQALESSSVPCRFPAELEMQNGTKVSFVISISIRSIDGGAACA